MNQNVRLIIENNLRWFAVISY